MAHCRRFSAMKTSVPTVCCYITTILQFVSPCVHNKWDPRKTHVAALVLARGGSKGIPLKNLAKLQGHTLLSISLEAIGKSRGFDSTWVSTDHAAILTEAGPVNVHWRAPYTATDTAPSIVAVQEFLQSHKEVDVVGLVQCTSPFVKAEYLDEALEYLDCGKKECVFSVSRSFKLRWHKDEYGILKPANFDLDKRPRRQDWDGELVENGMFYFAHRRLVAKGFLQSSNLQHRNP